MNDDSISSDQDAETEGSEPMKVYVPLDTLAVEGAMPEIGDEVDLHVKATVKSIEGSMACVSPTEVNGQPVPAQSGPPSREQLRAQAESDDNYAA